MADLFSSCVTPTIDNLVPIRNIDRRCDQTRYWSEKGHSVCNILGNCGVSLTCFLAGGVLIAIQHPLLTPCYVRSKYRIADVRLATSRAESATFIEAPQNCVFSCFKPGLWTRSVFGIESESRVRVQLSTVESESESRVQL